MFNVELEVEKNDDDEWEDLPLNDLLEDQYDFYTPRICDLQPVEKEEYEHKPDRHCSENPDLTKRYTGKYGPDSAGCTYGEATRTYRRYKEE